MITTVGELRKALEGHDDDTKIESLLLTRGGPAEWLWITDVRVLQFSDPEGPTTVVAIDTTRR